MTEPLYYAKGMEVWKSPVRTKIEGGESVTLGFHACTASEVVGEEGATAIAALLCLGEEAQASPKDNMTADDWFSQVVSFLVEHGMLDVRDEYDIADVMAALADNYQPEEKSKKKASYVGVPAIFELQLACNPIIKAFGHTIYHVGSSLERPDWRDVDLVMIMDDEDFTREFPNASQHGAGWELDPKWLLLTSSISKWLSEKSGVLVDFKFQPMTFANERHNGRRNPIGRFLTVSARKDEAHEKC